MVRGQSGLGPQERGSILFRRGGHDTTIAVPYEAIRESLFARTVGLRMIHADLAYMPQNSGVIENH